MAGTALSLTFEVGDYVIYNGTTWEKSDTTDAVASVAGRTGNVVLAVSDITASTSLALGVGSLELGHASDTTLSRSSAGVLAVEGVPVATTTGQQELTNKTLTNPTLNGCTEGSLALGTVGAASTLSITGGLVITATLTASTATTFTMPPVAIGKSFTLMLRQAAAGNGTATFTAVKWGTAGAPTITAAAGRMDIVTFFSDGVNWYGSIAQGFTP